MNIPYNYIKILKNLPVTGQRKKDQKGKGAQTEDKAKKIAQQASNISNQTKETSDNLTKSIDSLTQNFSLLLKDVEANTLGISKYVAVQEKLGTTFNNTTKQITFLEQRNKGLNKTFGISSEKAANLGTRYDAVAKSLNTGGKQIRKYAQELSRLLPLQQQNISAFSGGEMADFGKQLLSVNQIFRENLGMSQESVEGFARFAATAADGAIGVKDIAAQTTQYVEKLEEVTGLQGTTQAILGGIAGLASDVQLNFSKYPRDLGLAVLKTRMLGTSLGEVYSIGKNLLNIEQSVGNELEYQLLSGKRLVNAQGESLTQKFREATLSGDANASADALNEIIESQGDTIKDNFFARKQLAETLGIGEEKLSKMVQQRELLQDMGPGAEKIMKMQGEELGAEIAKFRKLSKEDPARKAFETLVKGNANALTTDEKQLYYLEVLTTGLIGRQVKLEEKSQAQIVKEQQTLLADPKIIEDQVKQAERTNNLSEAELVQGLNTLGKTALATQATVENTKAIYALIPGFDKVAGALTALNDVAFNNINTLQGSTEAPIINTTKGDGVVDQDFLSRPGGEKISFSSKDTIVGAKPGGPIDQMLASAGGSGASIDYGKIASAMAAAMRNVQIVAPTDIYRDSSMNIESIT